MVKYCKKREKVRHILLSVFFLTALYSKTYYSRVETIDIYTVSSQVSGEVLFVDENMLGKKLTKKPYIIIDDEIDKQDLLSVDKKLEALKQMISIDKEIIKNFQKSIKRKEENYNSIKNLSIKSKTQKDAIYFDLINTKNQLLNTKKEIRNLESQISDLESKKARLIKSIKDKSISNPGLVLYQLLVKKSQVVNFSTPLAKVADTSKAILTIYVDKDTLKDIKNKTIYINSKPTKYKISRLVKIADSVNISEYKVQIIIKPLKIYSDLVKVEFR